MNLKKLRKFTAIGALAFLAFYTGRNHFDFQLGRELFNDIKYERTKTVISGKNAIFKKIFTLYHDESSCLVFASQRGEYSNIMRYEDNDGDRKTDRIKREEVFIGKIFRIDMNLERNRDYEDNPDQFRSGDVLLGREFREMEKGK